MTSIRFCMLIALLTQVACTTMTYEGAGDTRVAIVTSDSAGRHAKFESKFEQSATAEDGTAFKPHDPISIYLKNAFFAWCPPHPLEGLAAVYSARKPKCRVAIVVNVGSRLEQNMDPASSSNPGRIVFYSRDIQHEQFVNQAFGPVYSSAAWDGNDLTLDVTILEMNEEDTAHSEAVLKVLSGLGTSPLLASGGQQLISALNRVGAAFVQASAKDSVIGYYRFTVLNRNPTSGAYIPILKEGDLILVRARDESRETIDWKNYVYDPSVGKMFERIRTTDKQTKKDLCNPKNDNLAQADLTAVGKLDVDTDNFLCYVEDHHRNYVVFSIVKSSPGGDWMPTTTLSALQTAIQSSGSVTALQAAVGTVTDAVVKRSNFLYARDAIAKLKDSKVSQAVKTAEANQVAATLQCGYINSLDTRALAPLVSWAQANCGGANWSTTSIATNEFENLTERILATCTGVTIADTDLLGANRDQTTASAARTALASAIAACH